MFRLKYLLLLIACILIYSYNYHFLWILYDVAVLVLAYYYLGNNKVSLKGYQCIIIMLTLGYFVSISISSGHTFIGLLSTWDTFKHILIFLLLIRMHEFVGDPRQSRFMMRLYHLIFVTILMQVAVVFYQVRAGLIFDNVAGTFGNGATHSMAYLSVLFVVLTIVLRKNLWIVIFSIFIGIWLNISAENVGFFVLLPVALLGILINHKVKIRDIVIAVCVASLGIMMVGGVVFRGGSYRDVIVSRVSHFILHDNASSDGASRGNALASSINRGGWFGNGPGSFTNIYLMRGYAYDPMDDPTQINIAESSHLIFESGIIGLVLTLMTYSSLLYGYFRKKRNKLFAIIFFCTCMFYGSLLMTETQFLLFLLVIFALKQNEYLAVTRRLTKAGNKRIIMPLNYALELQATSQNPLD